MHEMSIAESILQIIEDTAQSQDCSKIVSVWLEIGRLANIETESLRFCFDVVTRDSIAQGSRLEIIETPGQGWCLECACTVAINTRYATCPLCGSVQIQVTGGDEMQVKQVELA